MIEKSYTLAPYDSTAEVIDGHTIKDSVTTPYD
jgi:hypothetical protein